MEFWLLKFNIWTEQYFEFDMSHLRDSKRFAKKIWQLCDQKSQN